MTMGLVMRAPPLRMAPRHLEASIHALLLLLSVLAPLLRALLQFQCHNVEVHTHAPTLYTVATA